METPFLANNHAFLSGAMMQFLESFCEIQSTWHCNYIAYCFGVADPCLYRAFSIRSSKDLQPFPGLDCDSVFHAHSMAFGVCRRVAANTAFLDVESSAISCRRENTQKNIRALRSICSPERRRFCTELEVGIAIPGSAIHRHRLLN